MRHAFAALLLAAAPIAFAAAHETVAVAPAGKPVPKEQLMKPPADAVHYVVVSEAGKHGDQWSWPLGEGKTAYRWSQELRGWISEVDLLTEIRDELRKR